MRHHGGVRWPGVGRYLVIGDCAALSIGLLTVPWTLSDALAALLMPASYWALRLYRSRLAPSVLDDLPRLAAGHVFSIGAVLGTMGLFGQVEAPRAAMTGFLLVLVVRAAAYATVRMVRRRGWARYRTVIVGAGTVGYGLARALQEHKEYGLDPVGFVDDGPSAAHGETERLVLGGTRTLASVIASLDATVVVVAFGLFRETELVELLRTCDRLRCQTFLVPRLFELGSSGQDVEQVWGVPLVRLRRSGFHSWARVVKRAVDVAFSTTALIVLSPVLLVIAAAVRLEGGPGVIFSQDRVGIDGSVFRVLKFRSLEPVSDAESQNRWTVADDPRLGRVGRFIRATSLDELPQLWNVLKGDMSLVGPRPERPHFVEQFADAYPHYGARHRMPSGLTGWAQVHGLRGDTSIADRARFDNAYIETWSLWVDVKVMARTFGQVLRKAGR